MMCGHAAVLADELQVGREVVVAAGRVDVALAQEGLRGVLLPEERIVDAMTGGNFSCKPFQTHHFAVLHHGVVSRGQRGDVADHCKHSRPLGIFVGTKASGKNCACAAVSVAALLFLAIKLVAAIVRIMRIVCVRQIFNRLYKSDNLEKSGTTVGFRTGL